MNNYVNLHKIPLKCIIFTPYPRKLSTYPHKKVELSTYCFWKLFEEVGKKCLIVDNYVSYSQGFVWITEVLCIILNMYICWVLFTHLCWEFEINTICADGYLFIINTKKEALLRPCFKSASRVLWERVLVVNNYACVYWCHSFWKCFGALDNNSFLWLVYFVANFGFVNKFAV